MAVEDIGSLLIRLTVAWLFLDGAWASAKNKTSREAVTAATALVFKWRPHLFALAGIVMAGAGGLSVLLGIFPRIGALALTIFLPPAAMIHLAKRREALALKETIYTSAIKNLSLIGPTAYLVLAGARPPMLIGFGPDWHWHGLLMQF